MHVLFYFSYNFKILKLMRILQYKLLYINYNCFKSVSAHLFQTYLAYSLFRIPLHALWPNSLALIISRLFCLNCTGFLLSQNKFQDSCHHSHGPAVSAALLPRCTHSTLCACAITPLLIILVNMCSSAQNLHGSL